MGQLSEILKLIDFKSQYWWLSKITWSLLCAAALKIER